MATVKNTASGARGIRDGDGNLVMIEAGQSATGDFPASEVKDFNAARKLEGGQQAAEETDNNEPKALSAMNKADLLKTAADETVTTALDDDGKEIPVADATNKQIAAAIEKAREAK